MTLGQAPFVTFVHRTPASRVVFGAGCIGTLGSELAQLGIQRPLVLSGSRTAASALHGAVRAALVATRCVWFSEVPAHSSVDVVRHLVAIARQHGVDGFVAVGGGSASDTAKATALWLAEGGELEDHASRFTPPGQLFIPDLRAPKLPIVAVPGTASAAEVTPSLGVRAADGHKLLFTDPQLAARLILIDAQSNLCVPASLMLATGMNGLAHCLEGLYSKVRTPVSSALALHATGLFFTALPAVAAAPHDAAARGDLLVAAHLSGQVLLNARTGLHHAICHALGAATGIGHGDANAVLLPTVIAFNASHAGAELAAAAHAAGLSAGAHPVGLAAGAQALIDALRTLRAGLGVPSRLRDLGVTQSQLGPVAAQVMTERGLFFNPRPVAHVGEVEQLLAAVW